MTYTTEDLFRIIRELQSAMGHLCAAGYLIGDNKGYVKMMSQVNNYIASFSALYGEALANDAINERRRQYEAENKL